MEEEVVSEGVVSIACSDDETTTDTDEDGIQNTVCNDCHEMHHVAISSLSLVADEDNNAWIQCDNCEEWYHERCVTILCISSKQICSLFFVFRCVYMEEYEDALIEEFYCYYCCSERGQNKSNFY